MEQHLALINKVDTMGLPLYKSTRVTIRSLPQHIIKRVFGFLDVNEIKTLRQVCSEYDDMIFKGAYQRFFQTIKKRDNTITDAALFHREAGLTEEDDKKIRQMLAVAYAPRVSPCIKNIILDVDENVFTRHYLPLYNLLSRAKMVQFLDLRFLNDLWKGPESPMDSILFASRYNKMTETGSYKFIHWLGLSESNAIGNPMACYPPVHLPALKRLCISRAAMDPIHLANVTRRFVSSLEHLELDEVHFTDPVGIDRIPQARWYIFLRLLADHQRYGGGKLREVSFRDRNARQGDYTLHHHRGSWYWIGEFSFMMSRFCYSGPDLVDALEWLLHYIVYCWYDDQGYSRDRSKEGDFGIDGLDHLFRQRPIQRFGGRRVCDSEGEEEWGGFDEFEIEDISLDEIIKDRYNITSETN
ncbi:hypothetical protein F5Y18DRAFT_426462 [Xylariaceae sp. FL1019]|nr:hypothetical protein F5Y18DRAFT_426462 [Xylariaceae sp. FL1019]